MSLPKLPEGMVWRVYEWEEDKFVGIFPAEGYVWSTGSPYEDIGEEVSAYSKELNEQSSEALLGACESLVDVVFDESILIPPAVELYVEPEEELVVS